MNIKIPNTPKDHPNILKQKVGVIVGNLGTPDSTDLVYEEISKRIPL